jgi:gluconate 2-dehydrogenase gamma chain
MPSPSEPLRPPRLTRRRALQVAALATAGAGAGAGATALLTRVASPHPRRYRFFTDAEAALVVELCERIIPRDDAPGATDAGVIHYIDRQLAGRFARHRDTYRRGLAALVLTCRELHRAAFGELPTASRIAFLERLERGDVPAGLWRGVSATAFFRLLVEHTFQGYYGGSRHGGNRDFVSFRMLGIDYPQIIGRNRPRGS